MTKFKTIKLLLFCYSLSTSSVVSAAGFSSLLPRNHAVNSPFIGAPPRNQSIKFNIVLTSVRPISAQRDGLETVVREGDSQSELELVSQWARVNNRWSLKRHIIHVHAALI